MQVGIRFHDTIDVPLEERIKVVKEQGFSCVHMALSKVIKDNSTGVSALTPGYAMYLKKLFAKEDIDIAVLGCYLNLANPNQEQLKETMEIYKANIRFAKHLGCGVVGTETGAPNEEYKSVPECYSEKALMTFIHNLKPIVEYAEKMGVLIAIEPVVKHIVCNPKRARIVLDAIDSPNLRIIFDPVNLLDINNIKMQDQIINESLELLGKDIAVIHVKDYIVKDNNLESVAVGSGQMNWKPIMDFVKKEKPFIHATLEDTTPQNAQQAREYIQELTFF